MEDLNKQISLELGQAANLFPAGKDFPLLVQSAYKYQHCKTLGTLLSKSFQSNVIDKQVAEGLVSMALYTCENKYCYIIHSYRLLGLGFSQTDLLDLVKMLKFPNSVKDHAKWTQVLRLTFHAFKDRSSAIKCFDEIRKLVSPEEYLHYADIISLSYLLEYLITVLHTEIDYSKERLFITESGELLPEIETFVKYSLEKGDTSIPVFVICSYCKKVQSMVDQKWHHIDVIVSEIPKESEFSHSICPDCGSKQIDEIKKNRQH